MVAGMLVAACFGGAAHADPAPGVPGPSPVAASQIAQADGAAAAFAPPAVLPALHALFRAQAAAPALEQAPTAPWGVLGGAWQSRTALGDIGGLRPALAKYGVTLQLYEEAETFGNLTGGVRQGFEVNGVTTAQVQWIRSRSSVSPAASSASADFISGAAISAPPIL